MLTSEEKEIALGHAVEGLSLREIFRTIKIGPREFYEALKQDPSFSTEFQRVREIGLDLRVESLIHIADDCENMTQVHAARIKSDNIKWVASKINPRMYGDRIDLNVNQTVDIGAALAAAASRVMPLLTTPQPEREVESLPIAESIDALF